MLRCRSDLLGSTSRIKVPKSITSGPSLNRHSKNRSRAFHRRWHGAFRNFDCVTPQPVPVGASMGGTANPGSASAVRQTPTPRYPAMVPRCPARSLGPYSLAGFVDLSLPRPQPRAHDRETQQDQPTDSPSNGPRCAQERFLREPPVCESRYP